MKEVYVATIQVAVEFDGSEENEGSETEACDYIAETLRGLFLDWQYLKLGGQRCYPTMRLVDSDYTEGDVFN